MRVLVHALGCKVFGSKHVFDSLMDAVPPNVEVTAIAPGPSSETDVARPNVHFYRLPHRLFGQLLRPAVEVAVTAAAGLGAYDGLINLSSYGLCWSSNQVLYFHNPMIVENRTRGIGQGQSNLFKRYCLKTCLRGARAVFVQTRHMRGSVLGLCADWGLEPPSIRVLRPPVRFGNSASEPPRYTFQLFYPASDFAHKRASLAIEGAALAAGRTSDVGLVVTAESDRPTRAGVTNLGWISREEVGAEFSAASALLFTSEAETLGLPLLEALDRGLPAVLPDLPYARELYGEAAVYFRDPTPDSVCEAILQLKSEIAKYRELASKRRQEVRSLETSWPDHWHAFLEVIHAKAAVDI